jgi:hypothetical protein
MRTAMMTRRSRKWTLCAGIGGALAMLAAAGPGMANAATAAPAAARSSAAVKLSVAPLGINIPTWDFLYTGSSGSVVQAMLKKAGVDQIRYGGGTVADMYDWQTDTDIQKCGGDTATSEFYAACAVKDALDFSLYSENARAIHAQSFVTVNYGSGTPAIAAAWVKQAKDTPGQQVALWEIGNENYGCWEDNNELAGAPEDYVGYEPTVDATCPMVTEGNADGMETMATSYAANALTFMTAMRAQNPSADLGVPWAFGWSPGTAGASVVDNTEWNDIVLGDDAKYIGFVDVHYYPFGFGGNTGGANPTNQQVLQALFDIPSLYSQVRGTLNTYDPSAKVVVGETGVTYLPTTIPCTPTGALFAAGDALSWLAAGAQSIDWWQLNSYGNTGTACVNPDEGMVTSSPKPVAETPYIGYLLASALTQPGARLQFLSTSDPAGVMAFQSVLKDGKVVVAFINTGGSKRVTFKSGLSGKLTTISYKAGGQNAANTRTTTGKATAKAIAGGIGLPAVSITILETS